MPRQDCRPWSRQQHYEPPPTVSRTEQRTSRYWQFLVPLRHDSRPGLISDSPCGLAVDQPFLTETWLSAAGRVAYNLLSDLAALAAFKRSATHYGIAQARYDADDLVGQLARNA
jgi:hypothetical protein